MYLSRIIPHARCLAVKLGKLNFQSTAVIDDFVPD